MKEKLIVSVPTASLDLDLKWAICEMLSDFYPESAFEWDEQDTEEDIGSGNSIIFSLRAEDVDNLFKSLDLFSKDYEFPPGAFAIKRRPDQVDERISLTTAPAQEKIELKNLQLAVATLDRRYLTAEKDAELTEISQMAKFYSERAFEHALVNYELQLEFSGTGIERLEQVLDRLSSTLPRDSAGQLLILDFNSAAAFSKMCLTYGSFLGEAMRLQWHGEWKAEVSPHDARSWRMNIADRRFLPIVKVCRRMVNGSEENIVAYYDSIEGKHSQFVESYAELNAPSLMAPPPVSTARKDGGWLNRLIRGLMGER